MSAMSEEELQQLRIEFRWVADWHEQTGQWTPAETLDIGQAIKGALDAGDAEVIQCWRAWVAGELAFISAIKASAAARMRALEATIRAAREKVA